MLGKRCRLPCDPFEIVLESVSLLSVSACGIVGLVVDVPILERASIGLMMIRAEEWRVRGLFDQIVFGWIGQTIEHLLGSGFVIETGMNSGSAAEHGVFSAPEVIDLSCNGAQELSKKRYDIIHYPFGLGTPRRRGECD